jgi:CBS domain-containing protein
MASPNSPSVVLDAVIEFLRAIPPFQFLSIPDLRAVAKSMSQEYFPKDTLILSAGAEPADSLYIVKKGGVKLTLTSSEGLEVILDMRSEGELFGLLSMLGGEVTRLDVTAIEDTICYTIPGGGCQRVATDASRSCWVPGEDISHAIYRSQPE